LNIPHIHLFLCTLQITNCTPQKRKKKFAKKIDGFAVFMDVISLSGAPNRYISQSSWM